MKVINPTQNQIESIIERVVSAFKEFGSDSYQFKTLYCKYYKVLEAHKVNTLKSQIGKSLKVKGTLVRRGDGEDKNLNLISPLTINGVVIEHLHVYDAVLAVVYVKENSTFKTSKLEVFSYVRRDGSLGYGLKPTGEPDSKYSYRQK